MIAEERRWADTDDLSAEERELLDLLLADDGIGLMAPEAIPRRDVTADPPLSFAQQRLWFLHQLDPASPVYNMPSAVRLGGALDRRALARSLEEIVRRHETLRTAFPTMAGVPVQAIAPRLSVALPVVDLGALPPDGRARYVRELVHGEAHRPFDLSRGPLVRALLIALTGDEHVAVVTMHHAVSDGWSVGVLVREMGALYGAFAAQRPSPLPELPVQYADFSAWQRRWLSGERLEAQLAWWRERLAGAPQRLDLPTDRPRPPVQSFRGRTRSFVLPPELRTAVDALARAEGVTAFMVLLAAFDAWLLAYTGEEDLLVGSPIANRTRAEIEGLIGFFVNTLVLRTDLAGDPTFHELLGRVRDTALGAYDHQDVPFERLVEELQSERDMGANPLFQVMLQLENAPLPALELPGLTFTPLEVDWETAKFDLYVEIWDDQRLPAKMEYSTDLFDATTIERMVGHLVALLAEAVHAPRRRLSAIPLLRPAERHQIVHEWAGSPVHIPEEALGGTAGEAGDLAGGLPATLSPAAVYVVDAVLALVPIGVAGELCLGGEELAQDHAGLPEVTAVRFVPDPFGERPGGRLFRTGELARFRAGGDLELGGRLDRRARSRPAPGPSMPAAYVSPRGATEELLAGIWRSLLWVDKVGIHDSFFELGGHSLLATQLVSRLRTALGIEVPVLAVFKAPTIASLTALLKEMQGAGRAESPAVAPVPRGGLLPLSYAQERLWVLDQLEPGSPVYNLPAAVRLRGRLALPALARSLGELVARHETLRTGFVEVDGQPFQSIRPAGPYVLHLADLAAVGSAGAEAEAARLLAREAARPFDLAHDPMLRTLLLRLGPEEHVLGLAMHHIASDGWSIGIFIRELSQIYGALVAGRPSPLPPLLIQYADFAVWQREQLSGEVLAGELAYWRERLHDSPPALALPVDYPRPAVLTYRGGMLPFTAPAELADRLQELAHRLEATLFMVLLAGFKALLARLTGETDIAVGTPIAGRDRLETEGLIGFFVNTLVLRTDLADGPDFAALTGRVREVTLGAYAHQGLPFEKLVAELRPERSLGHTPLFQVMLALQNFPSEPLAVPGMVLEPEPLDIGTSKFELSLLLQPTDEGLSGPVVYNRELFTAGTVQRLLGCLTNLLAGAVSDPALPLHALPLLGPGERHQLLVEWSDGGPRPEPLPVLDLIRLHAAHAPRAVAVACEGEQLTYGELQRRAGRLAARLLSLGVGAEVPVALYLQPSVDLMVGILGILVAGAAYVPLDPEIPAERLALMIEDCGAPVLVTERGLAGSLPARNRRVLLLDGAEAGPAGSEDPPPLHTPLPESLAYVVYTSGSTGRPKGVAVEHRQLAHYLQGVLGRLDLPAGASYATVSTIAADLGNTMIFAALGTGGTLHLIPRDRAADPVALAAYFGGHAVDCAKLVPSHLSALLAGPRPAQVLPRRLLVLGGEACRWPLVERVRGLSPACRVLNHYGPTETTVGVLTWEVDPGQARELPAGVPLGRPLAGTRIHVLSCSSPVPPGVPGELLVGGPQVARGYLGRPDLTAERFVPDPWSVRPGERLYRTGDLVRHRPDGRIEFLGRIDGQIKLRGFRIEPGEIEAALRAHPRVGEAAVLPREEPGGASRRLIAYLKPLPGETAPGAGELREFLGRRLPEVMVPSAFVVVDEWPLNANGKLDRRALARIDPEPRSGEPAPATTAPGTATEATLARIWCEVLGRGEVGVDDNFFELGGDSILSIQVASRAAQAGLRLTPRQLFERQTVAGLAALVEMAEVAATVPGPAGEADGAGPVPLSPIQRRFFEQELPHPGHYNHALLLQAAHGRLEPARLAAVLARVLEHHEALRTRFEPPSEDRPCWLQVVGEPVTRSPLAWIDLSALPAGRRCTALEEAAARRQASLDLGRPPLFAALLFTLGAGEPDRVLLVAHHLVVDGVSWRILLEDMETVWDRLSRGAEPELPARTASLRRVMGKLADYARSSEAEAGFWLSRLGGSLPRLPLDHDMGPDTAGTAERVTVSLEPGETQALLSAVPRAYRARIHEVLLAAVAQALAAATASRRLLVDLEGHGRDGVLEEVDVSRTVGWLTSVYPVVLDLARADSPGEILAAVKEQLREIPVQGTGFGVLRYLGRDEVRERLAALPKADVVFNYLGQLDQAVAEGRLFRPAAESPGPLRDARQPRLYRLEISGSVSGGRLWMEWAYSSRRHRRATVEGWAGRFLAALRSWLDLGLRPAEEAWIAADFPLARLDKAGLKRVLAAAGGEVEDLHPPTPVQQGMLFHALRSPDSGVYVEQMSVGLEVDLDETAFERAWERLVHRHPALRTAFLWREVDPPLALVRRRVHLPWERLDWRGLPAGEQESRLRAWLAADRRRGFEPSAAPLQRLVLARLGERRYRFVWSHHHLLLDGWSTSILLPELFTLYEAEAAGREAALPPVRPFRDYAEWLGSQDLEAAEAFFHRELSGFAAPTPLGLDRPPGSEAGERESGVASILLGTLGIAAADALRGVSRRNQLTLSSLVEGAWAVLLGRYSGEEDVVFGAVTSGRSAPLPGIEAIVGLFINTLPARARMAPQTSVAVFLRELQRSQAEARQLEHVPLSKVQGWSDVPRDLPLFESLLVFENYPREESEWQRVGERLGVESLEFLEQTHYPLTVVAAPSGEDLGLRVLYDTGRFDAATATRILAHLQGVLAAIAADPGQPLWALPSLAPAERHQLLVEWNATGSPPATPGALEQRLLQQAARTPDTPAVVQRGHTLSHGELAARAGGLARVLRRLGVGPDAPVGICMERSPEMMVGVLGTLLAGGAYVPLDPAYPRERLAFMLEDALAGAGAAVLLTQERLASRFADLQVPAQVVCLDGRLALPSGGGQEVDADPANLAYVIYTSGSTGRPKGVGLTRGALANLLAWQEAATGLGRPARTLQFASLSFDVSFQEILSTLWSGGTLYLVDEETRRDAPALLDLVEREEIERLFVPFVALRQLAEVAEERGGGSLCLLDVVTAGEQLQITPAVAGWLSRLPGCRLHNQYGPSETHVVTEEVLSGRPAGWPLLPAIGRPVANTRVHLLDRRLAAVPVGAPGELYLGGAQLARGYLGRPSLTADRFLPDPFGEPGARLYRTGDLARYRGDGGIEYLGRTDGQVKIRGFRVEPGEVEAVLARHPAVQAAAVTARAEPGFGTKRLVAYVVPGPGATLDPAELRLFLAGELPEHMVPSAYVTLESLPLTASGKLDRRALPAPEPAAAPPGAAPRGPVEELVAEVWAAVLGRETLGIHDDFFALGGHSLLAVQVISRIRASAGVEVPLRILFERPTVALFAAAVSEELRAGCTPPAPPIRPVPRDRDLSLSFAQQRLWFLDQMEPSSAAYNIPATLRIAGRLDVAALAAALAEVVRRHEALRTVFGKTAGEPVQRIAGPEQRLELPLADLHALPGRARDAALAGLVRAGARRPFDLARGPLLRALLLVLGDEEHVLALAMHHIVSDAWSLGILVRELGALYGAFAHRRPSPLPPLPVQYADFACWQRSRLSGEVLEAELAYWRERLRGLPVLELPTDRPRPAVQTLRGAGRPFTLPGALRQELRRLARRHGATLFMVLLAAFDMLLHRYSGQDDVVVGTPVANRTREETEGLIGFFVNSLVLRVDLSGDPSFEQLVERARRAALEAFSHQDLPFEKLVLELQPKRSLSYSPLYQVVLTLQNVPLDTLTASGLTFTLLPLATETARFDLALALIEEAERIDGLLEYSTDLFQAATAERLLGHLRTLLEHAAAGPGRRLSEIPLLREEERVQLLTEWTDTARRYPQAPLVHELFALHARRRPWAVAVASRSARLTYGELEARSNRLAHHLRSLGVGPEVRVAICTERTIERVVGIVGVLKAGGAYVSIDPAHPADRLAFLLADAEAPVVLTEERSARALPATAAVVLRLDADWRAVAGDERAAPSTAAGAVTPEHLAYLVYTSGSTGRPKGVEIPHRGLSNLVRWYQERFELRPGDRGTQVASPAFDASVVELWPFLAGGGEVHIPDEETRLSAQGMLRWWSEAGITLAYLMTPLAEAVLEELGTGAAGGVPAAVRSLFTGGDRLHHRPGPGVGFTLWNTYGPAEYSVTTSAVAVGPAAGGAELPSIGRALPNTRIHVLDRRGEAVPIGVPGELYVGGVGLARGYLRRPDLTAETFLPDPWSGEPGARLYRTGDLVRHLPDGELDFLGRIDHQVKIRGMRIELGEIESALERHADLREAVVLVREDRPGDRRLVAYAVPAGERRPPAEELREFLRNRLPEYMVPPAFVLLDLLPLTPNGKVDRRALPVPESGPSTGFVPPRGPLEQMLAAVWSEVLQVERVGRDDNFFDLGGHSLLLVRLRDRLQVRLQREIPMLEMFQHTTLRAMAERFAAAGGDTALAATADDPGQAAAFVQGRRRQEQLRRRRREGLA